MADQCTLAAEPKMQQLQTDALLDWQRILDLLLDQSSTWEMEGQGSGGPKESRFVVVGNTQAPQTTFNLHYS